MPVQQHPIPQDVTNYKFRLVGDMTLKQFLQLAVGIVLGLAFWSSPLPFFFKYPLSILCVGIGIGMAFVPIEGRPLDQWLIAFFRSVYSPTIYTWQQEEVKEVKENKPVISLPVTVQTPQITPPPVTRPSLPIPSTPFSPNTLVGLTLNPTGLTLDDCMIEITQNGLTVRATKSNKLGQFLFAKPLDNGTYYLQTQKAGFTFESYSLNLTGQIIKPLRIQAKI